MVTATALLSGLFDPVREFFTLRRAERTVQAYVPAQQARVKACYDAAEARLIAGRRTLPAVPAAALLREALGFYVRAAEASQSPVGQVSVSSDDPDDAPLDQPRLAAVLPEVPADPVSLETRSADDARVRAALLATDPLYLDRLPAEDIERTRLALDRACGHLRGRIEVRSTAHLRGLRWGRAAAIFVLAAWATFAWVRAKYGPVNVALGKPVQASSRRPATPDGHELVDGETGTSYAVQTNTEESPNVVIDLLGPYSIDRVNVHNRNDGWFDECLPLVVEVSLDGLHYDEIGRREQHFDANPPWVAEGHGRPARFVRVRVARHGYLALSEVEVFGRARTR
jgi:hypothetical protein